MNNHIEYYFGEEKEEEYNDWLRKHRNTGFIINGFTNKQGTKLWQNKAPLHEASCPRMNHYKKGSRLSYGKLCGLDELTLIENCESRTDIKPTKECKSCFKMTTKSQNENENRSSRKQGKSLVTPEQWAKVKAKFREYLPVLGNIFVTVIYGTLLAAIIAIKAGSRNKQ